MLLKVAQHSELEFEFIRDGQGCLKKALYKLLGTVSHICLDFYKSYTDVRIDSSNISTGLTHAIESSTTLRVGVRIYSRWSGMFEKSTIQAIGHC